MGLSGHILTPFYLRKEACYEQNKYFVHFLWVFTFKTIKKNPYPPIYTDLDRDDY